MEEKPFKEPTKSSGCHDSVNSNLTSDIRNLWTTATLSQAKLNLPLIRVSEDSELEGSKTDPWYSQKTTRQDSDGAWEEWDDRSDKVSFKHKGLGGRTVELELGSYSSQGSDLEGDEDSSIKTEISSTMSSPKLLKHKPHRAYWVEQQNRLPLPLMELMESEALEILTKALRSYRSGIGRDHYLTKQLQRHIEGLRRRRNKRLHVLVR
ncbi:cation channel sperm-associated auxiliary subunit zeta [Pteronotus mesoamericanus]|uniref:cation channel sperm-associated auxiliary subunit zeta n=1 Tax=Pteronotus mesoamericanus TaxID=1884717 RepID=UPI0023ECB69C|nr:cation channel sperm-associated auxiliary subunit zeta [Pteronotus parnellii mesoamericanus]